MFNLSTPSHDSQTSKSYKVFKVKKKTSENFTSPDEDYLLEKEGDIKRYLTPGKIKFNCPRLNLNGEIVPHSIIGPVTLFASKLPEQPIPLKKPRKNKKNFENSDPKIKFSQMLQKISDLKKSADENEKKQQKIISKRRKLLENRQGLVLQHFQQTVDYWKNLEKKLAEKSKKDLDEVINKKANSIRVKSLTPEKNLVKSKKRPAESTMMWYMKLRESSHDKRFEGYLNVGNRLNGLYSRVLMKKDVEVNEEENEILENQNEENFEGLQVVGVEKLPLEIEAVNKIGCEFLNLKSLDQDSNEEIIAQHYERKEKARLI